MSFENDEALYIQLRKKMEQSPRDVMDELSKLERSHPYISLFNGFILAKHIQSEDDLEKVWIAATNAIGLAWLRYGDTEGFANFFVNLMPIRSYMLQSCTNIHKNSKAIMAELTNDLKYLDRTVRYHSGSISYEGQQNLLSRANRMRNAANEKVSVNDNLVVKIKEYGCQIYKFYIDYCVKESACSNELISTLTAFIDTMVENDQNKMVYMQDIPIFVDGYERILNNKKRKEKEQYWEEHSEEKKALDAEFDQKNKRRNELSEKVTVLSQEFETLTAELRKPVELSEEVHAMNKQLSQKRVELNNAGFFAFKKKKNLEQEISALNDSISVAEKKDREKHEEYLKGVHEQIAEKREELDKYKTELQEAENQLEEIQKKIRGY